MSERAQRRVVIRRLAHLDAVAVENRVGPGTPDVNCTLGWIELKKLARWRRGSDNQPVLIHHYTAQQRLWHLRRNRAGEVTFLLLQVGAEWLLFSGDAVQDVGRLTRQQLYGTCSQWWTATPTGRDLESCLRNVRL
jgi:hypothetical protein